MTSNRKPAISIKKWFAYGTAASAMVAVMVVASSDSSSAHPTYEPANHAAHPASAAHTSAPDRWTGDIAWGACFMTPTHWNVPLDGPIPLCAH